MQLPLLRVAKQDVGPEGAGKMVLLTNSDFLVVAAAGCVVGEIRRAVELDCCPYIRYAMDCNPCLLRTFSHDEN